MKYRDFKPIIEKFNNAYRQLWLWLEIIIELRLKHGRYPKEFALGELLDAKTDDERRAICLKNIFSMYINELYIEYKFIIISTKLVDKELTNSFGKEEYPDSSATDILKLVDNIYDKIAYDMLNCHHMATGKYDAFMAALSKHSACEGSDIAQWIYFYFGGFF